MRVQPVQDRIFQPVEEVQAISVPNLTDEEASELLRCINDVRQGRKVFYVRVTNHKVTNGRKRMPGQDYRPDPGLRPNAHEGLFTAAPTNRKSKVYLHILDEARAPLAPGEKAHGYTNISLEGIESFKVLGEFPGPLAAHEAPRLEQQPQARDGQPDPAFLLAQSLMLQAQAMFSMAMALQQQAMALQQPPRR